ncbi:transcriptional regulatory protein AlgP-like [Amphibalanus amphitrite]|uniref:transcriptional regulatory protein AlgP-like n=1 Tax=Amphibalanus amphitrite TaxID=1232801 RepID=UPI001C90CF34|nr:transcriptional regulatory protein AlgP-like [Amphibalanus amphitrite]
MDDLDWAAITGEPSEPLLRGSLLDDSLQLPPVKPKYWWQAGYVSDNDVVIHSDTDGSFMGHAAKPAAKSQVDSLLNDVLPVKSGKKAGRPKKAPVEKANTTSGKSKSAPKAATAAASGVLGLLEAEFPRPGASTANATAGKKPASKSVPVAGRQGFFDSAALDRDSSGASEVFVVPLPPKAAKRTKKPAAVARSPSPPPPPPPPPQPDLLSNCRPVSVDRMSVDSMASEAIVRPTVFPVPRAAPAPSRVVPPAAGLSRIIDDAVPPSKPPAAAKRGKKPAAAPAAGRARKRAPVVADTSGEEPTPRPAAARGKKAARGGARSALRLETSPDTTGEDWEPAAARRPAAGRRRRAAIHSESEDEGDVLDLGSAPAPPPGRTRPHGAARLMYREESSLDLSSSRDTSTPGDLTSDGADSEYVPTPAAGRRPAATEQPDN